MSTTPPVANGNGVPASYAWVLRAMRDVGFPVVFALILLLGFLPRFDAMAQQLAVIVKSQEEIVRLLESRGR